MHNDDELEDVEGGEPDPYDPFDDDDPDAPNLVPESGPSPRVLPGGIEMRELIGEGGMGKVYLAYHLRLRCDLAVKVLNPELNLRVDSQERLLREGLVLASIQHENIVRVHHCDKTPDGQLFIVMENLRGENLRDLRARVGGMDALAVVKIGLQICRALEVAHDFGVIHRDLTPSNVMVEPDGLVKVIDFGVCRLQDTFHSRHSQRFAEPPGSRMATPAGVQLGNPEYMAPELLREPFVSPNARTDVFSVAVVLFELLTDKHPFRHGDRKRARSVRELMPGVRVHRARRGAGGRAAQRPGTPHADDGGTRDALELAHDCILAQRGEDPDAPSPRRRRPVKLVRLDTFRPPKDLDEEGADDQPRARFLEIVRADAPADEGVEEPMLAPVVALRGTTTGPVPTTTETAEDDANESASDRAAPAVALMLPISAAPPPISTHAAPNWLTTHMIGLVLTTGLVGGVGVTLASQRIGESMLAAPARLAEAEAAAESCEGALEETQASLARTTQELRIAQQARIPAEPPTPAATPVPPTVTPPLPVAPEPPASPPEDDRRVTRSRHREVQRSLDKVIVGVRDCQDELGGGEMTQLRTRVRIAPDGQALAVEIAGKSDSTLAKCVTAAIRVRRYATGAQAEWVRHVFTFESEKEAP
ncbi:serine/threonine-protein kinase [Nannocystis sp.]|uniref:protein kinase domain-containing protein n=1 Tax=Nannocystis sp. TaxID=1962667 RepID=UPI0025D9856F|nr:serine/threonine-protein kinase [Nannocystis sp.]MBK7829558.1 serine/threonine protein kinase [Nannocystis sp.]